MSRQNEFERRIAAIEGLIGELEEATGPALRTASKELVQSLMDLHSACLERMLAIVHKSGTAGQAIMESFGQDEVVRSLLLLYGLHPVDLQTRVVQALETTRPYLRSHGGNVEFVGVDDAGVVTLRLEGSCQSCPSSPATLKLAVEQAIYNAAPDVTTIVVEGVENDHVPQIAFVPLTQLRNDNRGLHAESHRADWEDVFGLDALASGTLRSEAVAGQDILFCRLDETLYAYSNTCPGCGQPLGGARLEGTVLACTICRQRYDIVHAGRGVDLAGRHLEPVPLLQENGRARIVLPLPRFQRSSR